VKITPRPWHISQRRGCAVISHGHSGRCAKTVRRRVWQTVDAANRFPAVVYVFVEGFHGTGN
jgi:hypothetical protein